MDSFEGFTLARAIHILAVVVWIGGVGFVTLVLLPSLNSLATADEKMVLFERLENAFAKQAKITTTFTGLSGLYMLNYLDAWHRYLEPQFWWLHLMTLVWLLFSLVLFVFEPLFLHQWFTEQAKLCADKTFARVLTMHRILLGLSVLAVIFATLGAHGWSF